jgi:hypothetical protein
MRISNSRTNLDASTIDLNVVIQAVADCSFPRNTIARDVLAAAFAPDRPGLNHRLGPRCGVPHMRAPAQISQHFTRT